MILNFRSRVLRRFWDGDTRRVQPPAVARRVSNILDRLHAAVELSELEMVTGFYWLSGNRAQECAVTVTRNWRVTFTPVTATVVDAETGASKEEFNVQDVDFEDYH